MSNVVIQNDITAEDISNWLVEYLSRLLSIEAEELDTSVAFERYGLDSTAAAGLSGDLGDWLGCQLESNLVYNYPTIDAVTDHLVEKLEIDS